MQQIEHHEHLRLYNPSPGIYTIWPHATGIGKERSILGQVCALRDLWIRELVEKLGIRTVVWDTLSGTGSKLLRYYAEAQVNVDKQSAPHMVGTKGTDLFFTTYSVNRRDYGRVQGELLTTRDRLLDLECSVILVGHLATKYVGSEDTKKLIGHGFDAGGPGSVEIFTNDIPVSVIVNVAPGSAKKRQLITDEVMSPQGCPYKARVKGPHNSLEPIIDLGTTYEESSRVAADLMEYSPGALKRIAIAGRQGAGKSRFLSTICALPGMSPVLLIAGDAGEHEIPSWWSEATQAIAQQTKESAE